MIGDKIKIARKAKGLTLKVLGEKIGRTHSALSQIENGIYAPEKQTLIALARILNDNFGESWLDEYLSEKSVIPNKREIIEESSPSEIISLKFGGKNTRRSKTEAEELRRLLDAEIARMKDEAEKYGE